MTYLYAGLGVAMMAGIMAIFEMGLSITGQTLNTVPVDSYWISGAAKQMDLNIIRSLKERDERGVKLCTELDSRFSQLEPAKHDFNTSDVCVMEGNSHLLEENLPRGLVHRVLVFRDASGSGSSYKLFSCLTGTNASCSFEQS